MGEAVIYICHIDNDTVAEKKELMTKINNVFVYNTFFPLNRYQKVHTYTHGCDRRKKFLRVRKDLTRGARGRTVRWTKREVGKE